jgi:hypothetical protein
MRIRIFPLRPDLLILQNICDSMDVTLEVGAGLPKIDGTLPGFDEWPDGTKRDRTETYKWQTAYLVVETERQAHIVLARLRNTVRQLAN